MSVVGRHTAGTKQSSSVSASRSLTIAELTAARQLLAGSRSSDMASHQDTLHSSHSTPDSVPGGRVQSGPRYGRTVVQMLQNSLMQKVLSQEMTAIGSSSDSSTLTASGGQTGKLLIFHHCSGIAMRRRTSV